MNSPAEAFDNIFKRQGGRLTSMPRSLEIELVNCRIRMNDWLSILGRSLNAQNMPDVYVDFIANSSVNAAAIEKDDFGFIGFHWGTLIIIGDVFGRMLSHPEVFPSIGMRVQNIWTQSGNMV